MKRKVALALALVMGMSGSMVAVNAEEKKDIVIMIENADSPFTMTLVEMVKEKFPDYNIISKPWDLNQVEKSVKTTFASGESIDIAFASTASLTAYIESETLLDLTEYVYANDGEWANTFVDGSLDLTTYNEKVYGIPFNSVYPMFEVNMDVCEAAGVEVKDQWTWDEFVAACEQIKANTDAYPLGIYADWQPWLLRQAYLNAFDEEQELLDFNNGLTSFTDERIKLAFERAATPYVEEWCYPGPGAISATLDQINAGFAQGKIAIKADVNTLAAESLATVNLPNVEITTWPKMMDMESNYLLGGSDAYFIPANSQNVDIAVEIIKYLTGPECMKVSADSGSVVPVKGIESADPNYGEYSKDCGKIQADDIIQLSSEIENYINGGEALVDYIYSGETILEQLDEMRLAATEK